VKDLEVFAINQVGQVIGDSTKWVSQGFCAGMMVELNFFNLNAKDVAGWWSQAPGRSTVFTAARALAGPTETVNALSTGMIVGELAPPLRKIRKMRGGYEGPVIANTRSRIFHHPVSACAVEMTNPRWQKHFDNPEAAQKGYYIGCVRCIWDPLND